MIKGSIQQEDITLPNIYVPKIRSNDSCKRLCTQHLCTQGPKEIKQVLMDIKRKIDNSTVIVGNFNITLTSMDGSSRQIINKEAAALDNIGPDDLIDLFRVVHPQTSEYAFLCAHETFYGIDHMLGHKTGLSKFKIEIISNIISDHTSMISGMKLEIKNKKLKHTQIHRS